MFLNKYSINVAQFSGEENDQQKKKKKTGDAKTKKT